MKKVMGVLLVVAMVLALAVPILGARAQDVSTGAASPCMSKLGEGVNSLLDRAVGQFETVKTWADRAVDQACHRGDVAPERTVDRHPGGIGVAVKAAVDQIAASVGAVVGGIRG